MHCRKIEVGNEIVTVNRSQEMVTSDCCAGYQLIGPRCVKIRSVTNPCGNRTCAAVADAECVVERDPCGHEYAQFEKGGKRVEECNNDDYLACSGACDQGPCFNANCSAFNSSEVICSVGGCSCQLTWIHLQLRAEVDCETGGLISREVLDRRRRQACQ